MSSYFDTCANYAKLSAMHKTVGIGLRKVAMIIVIVMVVAMINCIHNVVIDDFLRLRT